MPCQRQHDTNAPSPEENRRCRSLLTLAKREEIMAPWMEVSPEKIDAVERSWAARHLRHLLP